MNTVYISLNKAGATRRGNADIALAVLGGIVCLGVSVSLSGLWEQSGHFIAAAVIGSVNGSVWEGVKVICISLLMWFGAQFFVLDVNYQRMAGAAALCLLTAAVSKIVVTCVCMGVLGFLPLWLDRLLAALAIAAGQWVSVKVQRTPGRVEEAFLWWSALLVLLLFALLSFTVNPPHIGLFFDPIRGVYGIA